MTLGEALRLMLQRWINDIPNITMEAVLLVVFCLLVLGIFIFLAWRIQKLP